MRAALPRVGSVLVPGKEEERTRLQTRLIHAGLYGRQAMGVFLGVKLLLVVGPAVAGAIAGAVGLVTFQTGLLAGCLIGTFGMIAPSFWLDMRKSSRQVTLRRAIPDALDVLVICLEGGASLPAAIRRLAGELRTAHPLLADELVIVQSEVHLGRSPGEALREFAIRADLEELRGLASVILQSERFGASLVRRCGFTRDPAEPANPRRRGDGPEIGREAVVPDRPVHPPASSSPYSGRTRSWSWRRSGP